MIAVSVKRKRRLVHSSVEGTLQLIAKRGHLRAIIKDRATGAEVHCTFPDDMADTVADYCTKRVIVEGMVYYRATDGHPVSITDITSIHERRVGRPLLEFVGTLPHLTGCLTDDACTEAMRADPGRWLR